MTQIRPPCESYSNRTLGPSQSRLFLRFWNDLNPSFCEVHSEIVLVMEVHRLNIGVSVDPNCYPRLVIPTDHNEGFLFSDRISTKKEAFWFEVFNEIDQHTNGQRLHRDL